MEVPKTVTPSMAIKFAAILVLLGVVWRLTPHLPNFAPIGAIALLAGQVFGWKKSLLVMLAIMLISDVSIGFYTGMHWTWLGFGLIAGFGFLTKKLPLGWRVPVGAIGASSLFFIVSNFGTWIASGMYAHTFAGLAQCYFMALPFLKATFLSDLLFTALLFSAYELKTSYKITTQPTTWQTKASDGII